MRKLKELADARSGIVIPASHTTRKRWAEYCGRTGQLAGLALERVIELVDSDAFRRFCRR